MQDEEQDEDPSGGNRDFSQYSEEQLNEVLTLLHGGQRPSTKRRRAPDEKMDRDNDLNADRADDDHDDNDGGSDSGDAALIEDFTSAKKKFIASKKLHYTPAPRYGGVEQNVDDGDKRGASYEIIKNKGLTPHRKKANRNPRVKKRQMYAKAVVARKGQVREVVAHSGSMVVRQPVLRQTSPEGAKSTRRLVEQQDVRIHCTHDVCSNVGIIYKFNQSKCLLVITIIVVNHLRTPPRWHCC